jgi:aminocarboxymuconate-semialdehyde decarboxylase
MNADSNKPLVIDIHSHFVPPQWEDLSGRFGGTWPWLKHTEPGRAMIMNGDKPFRPIEANCWDVEVKCADMERMGVDIQVISATPIMFAYDKPVEQASYVARLYNDMALEMCARSRGRLKALCQVPLQDIDAACAEVTRAVKDGHVGVQIGNHVGPKDLDEEGLLTFLSHCASENAAILVHPWDMLGMDRMKKYMMPWLVAMPAETQLSILKLILSGAFERLPRNLKICFAHGGGSFAFMLGRVNNAWANRDIIREDCPNPPHTYTDRFFVDSAVFEEGPLRLLVDVMGEDQVMLGSDYPYPLGEQQIGALVKGASVLSPEGKKKILGTTAEWFLGLTEKRPVKA